MKKLFIVATVAALIIATTLSVSAATVTTTGTAGTADVSVVFVAADGTTVLTPATVYSVDVIFEPDLEAEWKVNNITGATGMIWDPSTHTYKETDVDGNNVTFTKPDEILNAVTVKNHSNAAVAVSALFDDDKIAEANGAKAELSDNDGTLASAAAVAYGNVSEAASTSYTVSFDGTPIDATAGFKLGTISVTISAV